MRVITDSEPRTKDGRRIHLMSAIGEDQEVQFCGQGDDVTNGIRLGGQDFKTTVLSAGDTTVTWQYLEWVSVCGGSVWYLDANDGDYIHYDIYAPATTGTENVGAGAYDKYDLGGGYCMYIPNAADEGDWDLDLDETYNENVVFKKVVPVPMSNGFFDWDQETYAVTLNADGQGRYNIFDFPIHLTRIIHKEWLIPASAAMTSNFTEAGFYGAKQLLPNYEHKVSIHRVGTGDLKLWWRIFKGRRITTP